jgi:hypothetical protein
LKNNVAADDRPFGARFENLRLGGFHDVDPLTFDGDRFGAPLALTYGMNVPVNKDDISMFSGIHGLKQK